MGRIVRRVVTILLFSALAACAHARLNLPQVSTQVSVDAQTAAQVPKAKGALTAATERALLNALPGSLRDACAEMVEHWGPAAGGSQQWKVLPLHTIGSDTWLAFRCGSSLTELARFFDERLAVLRGNTRSLQFFPFDRDSETDSGLFHVSFSQELPVAGQQLVELRVSLVPDNPCCKLSASDGPLAVAIASEDRIVIYSDFAGRVTEALSLVTRSDVIEQDNKAGDTRTIYVAAVKIGQRTGARNVRITAEFREELNGNLQRQGTLRYLWNPATGKFDPEGDSARQN